MAIKQTKNVVKDKKALGKGDIAAIVAKANGLSKKQAEEVLASTLKAIVSSVSKGDDVRIVGFGTFSSRKREARAGRNPSTGKAMTIPAKKVVKFAAGKDFRNSVAGIKEAPKAATPAKKKK
jgi:nucleoid DNA-binding protein